jgi:hypothetical protein
MGEGLDSEIDRLIHKIGCHVAAVPQDADFTLSQMRFIVSTLKSVFPIITVRFDPAVHATKGAGSWISEEKLRISKRVENWSVDRSQVWKKLQEIFGEKIQLNALLCVASQLSEQAGVILDRDAKRRKNILVKWFEEHWESLSPHLDRWVAEHQVAT